MNYRLRFLAVLGAVAVSLIIAEKIVPRSGMLIAVGIGFFWVMNSGVFPWLTRGLNKLRTGVVTGNVGQ